MDVGIKTLVIKKLPACLFCYNNRHNGSAVHEQGNKDSMIKSDKDLEEEDCNKDKDS